MVDMATVTDTDQATRLWFKALDELATVRKERDELVVRGGPTYHLPEGMTAERLREMAKSFDFFDHGSIGSDLRAWADAIDPPKPPQDPAEKLSERLAMAEGLLRRAISEDRYHGNLWHETTSAEFLYLRSLDGEA